MEMSFRCRRALLAELRLLQPKRYAEMAVDALGLLNRSIQESALRPVAGVENDGTCGKIKRELKGSGSTGVFL
jgi:hypothetical protein